MLGEVHAVSSITSVLGVLAVLLCVETEVVVIAVVADEARVEENEEGVEEEMVVELELPATEDVVELD